MSEIEIGAVQKVDGARLMAMVVQLTQMAELRHRPREMYVALQEVDA